MKILVKGAATVLGLLIAGSALTGAAAAVSTGEHNPVTITSPSSAEVHSAAPEFQGTGEPGAPIVVRDGVGTVLCAARVASGGWSCQSVVEMADGPTQVTAVQNAWGDVTETSASFTVTRTASGPVPPLQVYWLAGAGAVALLLLASVLIVWRRVRTKRHRHVDDSHGALERKLA